MRKASSDAVKFLAALMCDIIDGRVSPTKANAISKQVMVKLEKRPSKQPQKVKIIVEEHPRVEYNVTAITK